MGHQPGNSAEGQHSFVLAVLRGVIMIAAAARPQGTSAVSTSKWRDQFLVTNGALGGFHQ